MPPVSQLITKKYITRTDKKSKNKNSILSKMVSFFSSTLITGQKHIHCRAGQTLSVYNKDAPTCDDIKDPPKILEAFRDPRHAT